MIVLGADMHKLSHTIAAIAAATGELRGEKTIRVGDDGFLAVLDWARALDGERVWALEDCRHVSGSFERFLISSGERVVRVATKLMSDARRAGRDRGKSDLMTRWRSRGPLCARASSPCRARNWPALSSTSGCWSITANG